MKKETVNVPLVDLSASAISDAQKRHLIKDQYKSDESTKFIGRGTGATGEYLRLSEQSGVKVNSGEYSASDVVFISANGKRAGRMSPDFNEIKKAVLSGATLLTDSMARRPEGGNPYNIGEQEVADFLRASSYKEASIECNGLVARWCPVNATPVFIEKQIPVSSSDIVKEWSEQIKVFTRDRFPENVVLKSICEGIHTTINSGASNKDYTWRYKIGLVDMHSMDENPHGVALYFKYKESISDPSIRKVSISSATKNWELQSDLSQIVNSQSYKAYQKSIEKVSRSVTMESTLARFGASPAEAKNQLPSDRIIRNVQVKSSF